MMLPPLGFSMDMVFLCDKLSCFYNKHIFIIIVEKFYFGLKRHITHFATRFGVIQADLYFLERWLLSKHPTPQPRHLRDYHMHGVTSTCQIFSTILKENPVLSKPKITMHNAKHGLAWYKECCHCTEPWHQPHICQTLQKVLIACPANFSDLS